MIWKLKLSLNSCSLHHRQYPCAHVSHNGVVASIGIADSFHITHNWDRYLHLQNTYTIGLYWRSYGSSPELAPLQICNQQSGTCHPIVLPQALHISQAVVRPFFQ